MNTHNALQTTESGVEDEFLSSFSAPGEPLGSQRPGLLRVAELHASVPKLRKAFLAAQPWPHLVFDDLIDPVVAAEAEKQEAAFAGQLRPHRSHRLVKAESAAPGGPAAKAILEEMLSPAFIDFVEGITGIKGLIGDPDHFWGGLHVSAKGYFQSIHTDFERHPTPGLFHRVNVLLYLNSEWDPGFGGDLEMWPKDMSSCGARIAPLLGRIVMFVTDPNTLHGVPDAIACPPGRYRLSLASYYYTREQPELLKFRGRILQAQRPGDPWLRSVTGPSNVFGALLLMAKRLLRRRPAPVTPEG